MSPTKKNPRPKHYLGRKPPKWLDLDMRPEYLSEDVHTGSGWNEFLEWLRTKPYIIGDHVIGYDLALTMLGLGLLIREGKMVNETPDDEFPEDAPAYLVDSVITMQMVDQMEGLCKTVQNDLLPFNKSVPTENRQVWHFALVFKFADASNTKM